MSKPNSILRVQNVRFTRGDVAVLDGLTLDINEGEYVGIIGPNGGGKTTLLEIVLGLLEPDQGRVEWFGEEATPAMRAQIGFVPQNAASFDPSFPATVEEVVASGRTALRGPARRLTAHDHTRIAKAMKTCGVSHLASRRIGRISGGERQRAFLARALAGEPRVLLLDEPMAAIDEVNQANLYDVLRRLHKETGMTIIMVSHDIAAVERETTRTLCLNRRLVRHGSGNDAPHFH